VDDLLLLVSMWVYLQAWLYEEGTLQIQLKRKPRTFVLAGLSSKELYAPDAVLVWLPALGDVTVLWSLW
jgi:hypothetical protein